MATAAANGHNCGRQAAGGHRDRIVMSGESFTYPLFDAATGTLMLPWWSAAVIVAVVVVLVLVAMLRGGAIIITGGVAAIAFLALVVATVWVGTERAAQRERAEERHALLTRAQDLAAKAATPGSALGCLDAAAGEVVETACERAVFASPEIDRGRCGLHGGAHRAPVGRHRLFGPRQCELRRRHAGAAARARIRPLRLRGAGAGHALRLHPGSLRRLLAVS